MELKYYLKNNEVLKILIKKGYKAYFVGGVVRDYILNNEIYDIDITTNAKPENIKRVFKKTFDTGIKHGTVTVKYNEIFYEITTFRKEFKYINNRYPKKVKFVKKLKQDLKRRDFTINSIVLDYDLNIIDLFNGQNDIYSKIIKTVGNSNKRFKEDALRMLRAIRFSCQLDFNIEKKTLNAIIKNQQLLNIISKERVYNEFKKIVKSDNVNKINQLYIFDIFKNLELNNIPIQNDYILRLSHIIGISDNLKILNLLKVDNKTKNQVEMVLLNLKYSSLDNSYGIKKLISKTNKETVKRILIVRKFNLKLYNNIITNRECTNLSELVITGKDLINENIIEEGEKIGVILNYLLDEVLKNPKLNNYDTLISLSKNFC